jgi:hypothetical protein
MHPGQVVFIAEVFFWCGLIVAAPVMTIWACFRSSKRPAVAVSALCLWCTLAGAALMGAIWGWMASENQQLLHRKLARLPEAAKPADVNLEPMKAIVVFVLLDRLGLRLGYLTVLLPLLASALIVRKTLGNRPADKQKPSDPESELFTPYGP